MASHMLQLVSRCVPARYHTILLAASILIGSGCSEEPEARRTPPPSKPLFSVPAARPLPLAFEPVASYWAPLIEHDMTGPDYANEVVTRLDFDGDWDLLNNMEHSLTFPQPTHAYSWVVESATHFFLGYAFYHTAATAPDFSQNDLQGVLVVVDKHISNESPVGRFVALITWTDGQFLTFVEKDTVLPAEITAPQWQALTDPSRQVKSNHRDLAGDVNFLIDHLGFHPVLYMEADSHRLVAGPPSRSGGTDIFKPSIVDWTSRSFNNAGELQGSWENAKKSGAHGRKSGKAFAGKSWGTFRNVDTYGVFYHFEGVPERTKKQKRARAGGNGTFYHQFQVIGYSLLSLAPLWEQRMTATGSTALFVDDDTLSGNGVRGNHTRAPWGWREQNDPELRSLDPVFSPGALVQYLLTVPGDFSPATLQSTMPFEKPASLPDAHDRKE